MIHVLEPAQTARVTNIKRRSFIYLQILGVASKLQRKGFGGELLGSFLKKSKQLGVPDCTETSLEKTGSVYETFGFRVLDQITLLVYDLRMWVLVRETRK